MSDLEWMINEGLIEESRSAWSSPMVIVAKKDSSYRICIDYRKINAVTKFDAYPMPRIDEMLDWIGKVRFISTLDLAKGYGQVPMDPADKEKMAFSSPRGLYQFNVMPFGLNGAPATFQRMMDHVLQGTEESVGVYLDDIVVYSNTWPEHLQHLKVVLQASADRRTHFKI